MFWKTKAATQLEKKLSTLQMHFENNYKDEAHKAYKETLMLFEQLKEEGKLSAKELEKYQKQIDEFTQKLNGYTHYNHIGW